VAGAVVAEELAGAELAVEEEVDARVVVAEPGETSSEVEAAAQDATATPGATLTASGTTTCTPAVAAAGAA